MTKTTSPQPSIWKWVRLALIFIPFVFLGGLFGRMLGQMGRAADPTIREAVNVPLLIVSVIPAFFLVLLTHELGHLLAGRLVGFKFLLLIVGPFKVLRGQQGLNWGWNTNWQLAGGLAASVPTQHYPDLNRRLAVMVAGGPAASILLALVGGLAAWALFTLNPQVAVTLAIMAFSSTVIGLVTLIPGRTSGFMTDGAQLLALWRGGAEAEQRAMVLMLQASSMSGVRPRDWDLSLVQRALLAEDSNAMTASALMMAYAAALDRGEIALAGEYLDRFMAQREHFPEGFRQGLDLEAAFFEARHRHNPARAREHLARGHGGVVEAHIRLRAEAAVLLAEGRHVEAGEKAQAALKALEKAWDVGSARADREALEAIQQAARVTVN